MLRNIITLIWRKNNATSVIIKHQKVHINSPRPEDGLKRFPKEVLAKVLIAIYMVKRKEVKLFWMKEM